MSKKTLAPQADQVINSTEIPVGRVRTQAPQKGKTVKRVLAGGGGMDPSMGTAVSRRQIQERMGARRRVEVALPGPSLPEAKATQANGRIISGYPKERDNFQGGAAN